MAGAKAGRSRSWCRARGRRSPRSSRFSRRSAGCSLPARSPGLAQMAKLANNLLAAAALVVSSEAMAMGVKAGLDAKVLIDIINAGSGRNSATQDKFPRVDPAAARSTSGSPPGCPTRTSGCASTRPRRWACRWSSARRCGRCSPSRRRSSARRPISPASRRCVEEWAGVEIGRSNVPRTNAPRTPTSNLQTVTFIHGAAAHGQGDVRKGSRDSQVGARRRSSSRTSFKTADDFNMPMQELVTEYCWGAVLGPRRAVEQDAQPAEPGDDQRAQPAARAARCTSAARSTTA